MLRQQRDAAVGLRDADRLLLLHRHGDRRLRRRARRTSAIRSPCARRPTRASSPTSSMRRLEEQGFDVVRPRRRRGVRAVAAAARRFRAPPRTATASPRPCSPGEQPTLRFERRGEALGGDYDQSASARASTRCSPTSPSHERPEQRGRRAEAFAALAAAPRALTLDGRSRPAPARAPRLRAGRAGHDGDVHDARAAHERRRHAGRRARAGPAAAPGVDADLAAARSSLGKWIGQHGARPRADRRSRCSSGACSSAWTGAPACRWWCWSWSPGRPSARRSRSCSATSPRTEGQAVGIGVLATNVLAALGGCWWPIEITPAWMQTLALVPADRLGDGRAAQAGELRRCASAAVPARAGDVHRRGPVRVDRDQDLQYESVTSETSSPWRAT